jgi:hypothetical protein
MGDKTECINFGKEYSITNSTQYFIQRSFGMGNSAYRWRSSEWIVTKHLWHSAFITHYRKTGNTAERQPAIYGFEERHDSRQTLENLVCLQNNLHQLKFTDMKTIIRSVWVVVLHILHSVRSETRRFIKTAINVVILYNELFGKCTKVTGLTATEQNVPDFNLCWWC